MTVSELFVLANKRVLKFEHFLFRKPRPVVLIQNVEVFGDAPQLLNRLGSEMVMFHLRLVLRGCGLPPFQSHESDSPKEGVAHH